MRTRRRESIKHKHPAQTIAAIIAQYARKDHKGEAQRCTPTRAEIDQAAPRVSHPNNDGKVIYPDVDAARLAAAAIWLAVGGPLMRPYECERSQHGHAHLTSSPARPRDRAFGRDE